ncbi:beta-N-acetylhexosaminidase [Rufibacter glacialis]|nr:beta-N-acetylhexosaminidase [Rufibacter glacialis]
MKVPPQADAGQPVALIPLPQKHQPGPGAFRLQEGTSIVLSSESAELRELGEYLAALLHETSGRSLPVSASFLESMAKTRPQILLRVNPTLAVGAEGYALSIQEGRIVCEAKAPIGLFWAVQTLRQMIYQQQAGSAPGQELRLPVQEIHDEPTFAWRGLLLDMSRHFMSKDFLKRYIDLLALYKLNTLHLHLTDDQGWRLQIPNYPKLTSTGAWRQEPDGSTHGGFYTQADIREIVAYAQSRYITVVPEVDMPGHVQAALAAYPELSCTGGPFRVSNRAGVHPDILCAGNEQTYAFVENVLAEVARLFPGQYVHIGGDEAPKNRWKACAKCQARMKKENLPDEEALQGYFTKRASAVLQRYQKKPIVWDEALKGGISAGTLVQAWHGPAAAKEAVAVGAPVINSPRSAFYFDLNSGITPLEKVYHHPMVPAQLPAGQQQLVLGAEAALWTEDVPQERVDEMIFPRLLAFAENAWGHQAGSGYPDFRERVQAHYPVLERLGVRYGFGARPITFVPKYVVEQDAFAVTLEAGLRQVELRYTLDGTEPTRASALYTGVPVQFAQSTQLRVRPFKGEEPYGATAQASFVKHLALNRVPALAHPFHTAYAAGGGAALTDGILADNDYRKGFWQGFEKEDLEAIIDLGAEKEVREVSISFLQDTNSWIFLPTQVTFSSSNDKNSFKTLAVLKHAIPLKEEGPVRKEFTQQLPPTKTRYLRVRARNVGVCPPWHPGAGGAAFLMADELIVR